MPELFHCQVLVGPELEPVPCERFSWDEDGISAIEPAKNPSEADAWERVIMPAMINGHTHVGDGFLADGAAGLTLEEGFFRPNGFKYRELEKVDRPTHIQALETVLRGMAASGTVIHLDFREQGAEGASRLREASEVVGLQSIILNQFQDPPFDEETLESNVARLPAAAGDELDSMLKVADGFSESTMNDLPDPAWEQIAELTHARGKLRAIHVVENAGYRSTSVERTGRGDVARALDLFEPHLVVHMTDASSAEIELVRRSRVPVAINPRANATLALPAPPLEAMMKAGLPLILGTDNVMLNPPNLFAEMDYCWKLARSQQDDPRWPDPLDILKMTTVNGGDRRFHPSYTGIMETGGPANFLVLDFSAPHLRYSRNLHASLVGRVTPADILATFFQGDLLYHHPKWETIIH